MAATAPQCPLPRRDQGEAGQHHDQRQPDPGRVPLGGHLTLAALYQQLIWELNQHGGQAAYLRGMQRGIEDPMDIGTVWGAARDAGYEWHKETLRDSA